MVGGATGFSLGQSWAQKPVCGRPLGLEKMGGGWFREEAALVIPLVVRRPAVDSSLNPISATRWLCDMGYVTSGLSFLSCKVGMLRAPTS